ncbi:MAG TPA: hypothetical protein VNK94_00100 [Gaiellaceae bacterium]|nr:hypothetical protein [Gaiellaceae bacterium]
MSVASASLAAARGAGRTADRLLEHPRAVLGTLVAAQVGATLVLALAIEHNGWVFFQGGDQIWLATQGWLLGGLELPPTELGYLWSALLAPVMWITGPTYVQALPPLVVFQVLVLGPIALLCVYGIAARIGGRLLGYWASLLWVVAPYAAIPLFVDRYQERWSEHFLPQALGLTAMSDYPSLVLVLASAYFLVRSLRGVLADAVMAGLLLGAAGSLKPPNLLLGAGAALAYLAARRWREAVAFGLAVVPSLVVLALWKERGLGRIPAFALDEARLAAGTGLAALDLSLDRYLELDVDHWRQQMDYLREFFWSARLAQWAPFAGLLAVLRVRQGAIAGLLAGWLGAFLVVKGFSTRADIQANTFWRLLMPAWPAYLLLFASIPLLVPTLARRLGDRLRPPEAPAVAWRWIALLAAVAVAVPAIAIAAADPVQTGERALFQGDVDNTILTPVDEGILVRVERAGSGQRLTWTDGGPWRARVFFRVYRDDESGPDVACGHPDRSRAAYCTLQAVPIATTREREYVDPAPPPGATYRVGVATNWADDPEQGDVFVFSPPVRSAP